KSFPARQATWQACDAGGSQARGLTPTPWRRDYTESSPFQLRGRAAEIGERDCGSDPGSMQPGREELKESNGLDITHNGNRYGSRKDFCWCRANLCIYADGISCG